MVACPDSTKQHLFAKRVKGGSGSVSQNCTHEDHENAPFVQIRCTPRLWFNCDSKVFGVLGG